MKNSISLLIFFAISASAQANPVILNQFSTPAAAVNKGNLVVSCQQKGEGCHQECGLQECDTVCVNGVDLKIYRKGVSTFQASISVFDATTAKPIFNETTQGFELKSEADHGHGFAEFLWTGILNHPNDENLKNHEARQRITINVEPTGPNRMFGFLDVNVDCDYTKVTPQKCFGGSLDDARNGQGGSLTSGRFECQYIDKPALGL